MNTEFVNIILIINTLIILLFQFCARSSAERRRSGYRSVAANSDGERTKQNFEQKLLINLLRAHFSMSLNY